MDDPASIVSDHSASTFARRRAAESIASDPQAHAGGIDALLAAVQEDDRFLRHSLLELMARIDDARIRRYLRTLVEDDDSQVRRLAIAALGAIGTAEDRALLQACAQRGQISDSLSGQRALEHLEERLGSEARPAEKAAAPPPAQASATTARSATAAPAPAEHASAFCGPRHQAFFADQLEPIAAAYAELQIAHQRLPSLQQALAEAQEAHDLTAAEHASDIRHAQEALEAAEHSRGNQRRQRRRNTRTQRRQQRQQSWWQRLLTGGSAQQDDDDEDTEDDDEGTPSQGRAAAEAHLQQVQAPLQAKAQALEDATLAVDECIARIATRRREVLDQMVAVLRSPAECQSRLQQLIALEPDCADLLAQATAHITRASQSITDLQQQETALEHRLSSAQAALSASLADLGSTIAEGFQSDTRSMEVPIRVHGSISFNETGSVLRGIGSTSGQASGRGTGKATYELQHISWQHSKSLEKNQRRCGEHSAALGQLQAEEQHLHLLRLEHERTLEHYAGLLHEVLLRDSREQS